MTFNAIFMLGNFLNESRNSHILFTSANHPLEAGLFIRPYLNCSSNFDFGNVSRQCPFEAKFAFLVVAF